MKKASANISLEITVECPYCECDINLLDDNSMTDDGHIYNAAMDDKKGWGCKDFNEKFECPKCHKYFIIESIEY